MPDECPNQTAQLKSGRFSPAPIWRVLNSTFTMNRYSAPAHVIGESHSGETVLLNLNTGVYFGLDPVGSRAWELLLQHGDLPAVVREMSNEFDVDEPTLNRDLEELLGDLTQRGLLLDNKTP